MILLHGNPSHLDHFRFNVQFLRQHGEVALLDLPGFGRSPDVQGPLSLDFYSDVVIAFAESMGWSEGIDLIGQSHGGAVAQTVVARHPGQIRSLILLGTMGYPAHFSMRLAMLPGAETVTFGIARRARKFPFSQIASAFARVEIGSSFNPDPIPDGFIERELESVIQRPVIQRSSVRANSGNPSLQLFAQASKIRVPALFIHGRRDRLVPIQNAKNLFTVIQEHSGGSGFVEIDGGHMVHFSCPDRVNEIMRSWFSNEAGVRPVSN